jgi:hypothetical protein
VKLLASAALPLGPLTSVYAFAVSPDESWLAVSERSRGAVWNLRTGERPLFVRGFAGGYFDQQDGLWADVSAFNDQPRTIVRMTSTPPAVSSQLKLDRDAMKGLEYQQLGEYLAVFHFGQNGKGVELEMRKVEGNKTIWTHAFKDGTSFFSIPITYVSNGNLALLYDPETARQQVKVDPALRDAIPNSDKMARTTSVIEVLDLATGKTKAAIPVMTKNRLDFGWDFSSWLPQVAIAGERLLFAQGNRITSYSLAEKKGVGVVFGNSPVANAPRNLLATRNDRWHVTLRDLDTLQKKDEFGFASPVATMRFSSDGNKLYVLTQDQTFFILSTGASAAPAIKTAMQ